MLRHTPILPLTPFKLFVVDSFANSLQCVGKTERIGPQIIIDVSFNPNIAIGAFRFCQDTQCGEAWLEPRHVSSWKSPLHHERCCKPPVPAMAEQPRLNVNRATACKRRPQRD